MSPATTWMNLEDIMLSEMSQSQKSNYCMASKVVKFIETLEWWLPGPGRRGKRYRVSILQDENWRSVTRPNTSELYTYK